jgi:hypothetical protein
VTINNLSIDIVRLAINIGRQVLLVIKMKSPLTRLEQWAGGGLRNRGQTSVARIARRQVTIDREQFVRVQCARCVPCKLSL